MKEYLIEYLDVDDDFSVKTKTVFGQSEDQIREQAYKEYGRYGVIFVKPI
jgi:hypothetical protein